MIILDASVVFKWFDETEKDSETALSILQNHLSKKESILVPDLILYEILNAWSTKSDLSRDEIKTNLQLFRIYSLKIVGCEFSLLERVIVFSKMFKVSAYDATYAVLAQEKKCELITADDKFANKVNLPLIRRLSEYSV